MYEELVKRLNYCRNNAAVVTDSELVEIAEQAADAIEELQKVVEKEQAFAKCWEELAQDCKARFQKLLDAYPKWISVEERLPGYGEKCLVAFKLIGHNHWSIQVSYCYVQKEGFWSDCGRDYKAVAWMPLPEPPKDETE